MKYIILFQYDEIQYHWIKNQMFTYFFLNFFYTVFLYSIHIHEVSGFGNGPSSNTNNIWYSNIRSFEYGLNLKNRFLHQISNMKESCIYAHMTDIVFKNGSVYIFFSFQSWDIMCELFFKPLMLSVYTSFGFCVRRYIRRKHSSV